MNFKSHALLISIALFLGMGAYGHQPKNGPVTIAVIDTGFGYEDRGHGAKLCQYGHKDFSSDQIYSTTFNTKMPVPVDYNSHGTNVVGIIDGYLKETSVDYCLVIIKYNSEKQNGHDHMIDSNKAIQYASNIGANYINYSGEGPEEDLTEKFLIKNYIDQGGIFIASSGNEGHNIDIPKNAAYPALDDPRVLVVGNLKRNGEKMPSSNYGEAVKYWEVGEKVTAYGLTLSGTSQSTAVETAKKVYSDYNKLDKGSK